MNWIGPKNDPAAAALAFLNALIAERGGRIEGLIVGTVVEIDGGGVETGWEEFGVIGRRDMAWIGLTLQHAAINSGEDDEPDDEEPDSGVMAS